MSEQPKKRLVSKGHYAWIMAGKTTILGASVCCFLIGGCLALTMLAFLYWRLSNWSPIYNNQVAITVVGMLCSGVPIFLGRVLFQVAQEVERVAPITRHTTSSLPPEKSLVRASDAPPSQQQAELLRAAGQGAQTPPEQMLRAAEEACGEE